MASLNSLYLTAEKLETLLKTVRAKKQKGVEITISINDEVNDYDQNISAFVSQTKEQRDAKAARFYVGNGKTFWSNGQSIAFKSKGASESDNDDDGNDDLPF